MLFPSDSHTSNEATYIVGSHDCASMQPMLTLSKCWRFCTASTTPTLVAFMQISTLGGMKKSQKSQLEET